MVLQCVLCLQEENEGYGRAELKPGEDTTCSPFSSLQIWPCRVDTVFERIKFFRFEMKVSFSLYSFPQQDGDVLPA